MARIGLERPVVNFLGQGQAGFDRNDEQAGVLLSLELILQPVRDLGLLASDTKKGRNRDSVLLM